MNLLLNLKKMTATEKVQEALMMRGLFVEVQNEILVFSKHNAKNDVKNVQSVLNQLNIPFIMQDENKLEILINQISILQMEKILTAGGHPFDINAKGYHQYWRFFVNRRFGFRVNTFQLEYNMASFVRAANLAGIATYAGCNGHLKKSPRFQLAGPFMGAWFTLIQKHYFQDLKLNYNWKVMYDGFTGAELRATGNQEWCQHKIHEDTLKMAFVLKEHAANIRELKNTHFKRAQKQFIKKWVEKNDFKAIENWMDSIVWGNENVIDTTTTRAGENMAS
ncbi:hypothetical protein [Rummeliibacillus suwonensis]|uniref:hypothetical protein n=1 Tax=Rummeliibacillus suwonensis TaxID=1306154 RepID=UPI00289869A7|nr:hypothetical protein [Rummeliibacillus suwonensis]